MFEYLAYEFMQRAIVAGVLVALSTSILGTYLSFRRLSLIGDGLSHAAFGGVAVGFLLGVQPLLTALLSAVAGSIVIQRLMQRARVYGDSAIALVLATSMAVAITIIGHVKGFSANLFSYIFGSVLTVNGEELMILMGVAIGVLLFLAWGYKKLLISSFNEDLASTSGIKTQNINLMLMVLTAATVVVAMRAVGILLVGGMLVIPTLAALQISRSFRQALLYSIAISSLATVGGLLLSFELDLPPSGIIILAMTGLFGVTVFFGRVRNG